MVVKNLWLMLVVCTLFISIGCAGSPVRDCLDNAEGIGKVGCGYMILPVLGPVLPADLEDAADE